MDHKLVALCLATFVLGLAGCRKESDRARWDVDVAVPLVITELTIGDLLPDSLLSTDDAGNVTLLYTSRLFTFDLDTILQAPDTSFRYSYFPIGITLNLFPGTEFNSASNFTRFELDELELRELRVRSGQLSMEVVNRVNTSVYADFGLPGATLDGQPFTLQLIAPPGSSATPSSLSSAQDLAGFSFDLRGPGFNDVNTITTTQSFTTDPDGPIVSMSQQDSLEAYIRYEDVVPSYARGYFGMRHVDADADTTVLDIFENISGLLILSDATARLEVTNGIGAEVRAHIDHLRSINAGTGNTVELTNAIVGSPVNIDRALDLGNGFQAARNIFHLNAGNSNIIDFIENLPTGIGYDLDVTLNPLGDVSNGNDFFYHESKLMADLAVEIPLRLAATDLTLTTTTDVDLGGTLEEHAIGAGVLHVFADNTFPFSAAIQLDIVDGNGTVLSPLGSAGTITAAPIDLNGLVTGPASSQVDVTVSAEQVRLLYPGGTPSGAPGRLRIRAVFNTQGQPTPVQLQTDHSIGIRISYEGNYTVNGDGN